MTVSDAVTDTHQITPHVHVRPRRLIAGLQSDGLVNFLCADGVATVSTKRKGRSSRYALILVTPRMDFV